MVLEYGMISFLKGCIRDWSSGGKDIGSTKTYALIIFGPSFQFHCILISRKWCIYYFIHFFILFVPSYRHEDSKQNQIMLFLKLLVTVLYSQRVYLLSYLPIILPCIFTKLSPLNFVFVIMDALYRISLSVFM